jgi:hypothetical protein
MHNISLPLNAGQNRRHIIRWAPSVLQDIQTKLASGVHVRVEHRADKLHSRRLIRVLLFEVHDKPEGAVFEGRIRGADDDRIPCPQ